MSASENRGDIFALSVRPEVRGIAWSNYSSSDDDVGTRWRSASNLSVSPERSLQSTVVISCVRIISESIAGLPLSLYRKTPNGSREIASELHLHKVLSFAPNNWQTKFEFIEQVCINLLLWGNSYSLIQSGQHGAVESLHNLHPSRMQVDRLENGRLRYTYTNPQNGGVEYYTQDAIMHIRWTPEPDGMKGMVPVQISRDAIALARSLEIHASKFWANAARPGTVLTHPGNLSSEAAEKLRDNWERAHMGCEKSYKTAVLTGGLQVTELGFTNEASQFVASRTFQTEEICRIYRLPLHLVQGTSSGSLEVQGQEFVTWTLAPWLERIQSAISRSLIYNDDLFVAGFDTRGLLRADSQSRASYYSTCTNLGILSINECRAMEGLSPLGPEADNHFIGMNQQTIQDAAKPKVAPDPGMPPPPATGGVPSLPGVATGAPPSPSEIGVASAVKNPDKRAWCEGDVGDGGTQLNNCSSAGISTGGKFDVKKLLAKISSPDSAEGFTLDVLTADQPETGIMVSTFHNDSDRSTRIPKSEIHTDAAAKVLKDFIEVNSREIIDRPDRYIGGWLDGDEFYLDIATRFDPDKAEAALEAGRDAGQLAVFNLGTFKETYIHYSPQDTRLPMGWNDSFARAKKKAGADHAELDAHGHTSVRMMEALAARGYTDAESRAIVSAIHGTEEDDSYGREAKETGGHEGGRAGRRQQTGSVPRDESVGRAVGEEAGEDVGAGLVRGRAGRFARFVQLAEEEARVYCSTGAGGGLDNSCGGSGGQPAWMGKVDAKGTTGHGEWFLEQNTKGSKSPGHDEVTTHVIRLVGDSGKVKAFVFADAYDDRLYVNYAAVAEADRGKGVYTQLLSSLQKQFNVTSDEQQNVDPKAKKAYESLGATVNQQGQYVLKKASGESRAFCPTGTGGGVQNDCGASVLKSAAERWKGETSALGLHAQDEIDGLPLPPSGSGKMLREQAKALLNEVIENGEPAPDLYRGDNISPQENNSALLGWSSDKSVAEKWAKTHSGEVFTLSGATGLKLSRLTSDPESEWVVLNKHPDSKQSRAFCPTGDGGGVNNDCSSQDGGDGQDQDQTSSDSPAKEQEFFGTLLDSEANHTTIESSTGPIDVIDRSDVTNAEYLKDIEANGKGRGLITKFDSAVSLSMQRYSPIKEDVGPYAAFVRAGCSLMSGTGCEPEPNADDTIDYNGTEYGTIPKDESYEMVGQRAEEILKEKWKTTVNPEFEVHGWGEQTDEQQDAAREKWMESNKVSAVEKAQEDVDQTRKELRQAAIPLMRRDLEKDLARTELECCLQLYRGMTLPDSEVKRILKDGFIGHESANSWTTSTVTARVFGGQDVLLVLRSPTVGHIYATDHSSEKEITRPPSKMRIVGVVKTKGGTNSYGTVMYLEEDPDYKRRRDDE